MIVEYAREIAERLAWSRVRTEMRAGDAGLTTALWSSWLERYRQLGWASCAETIRERFKSESVGSRASSALRSNPSASLAKIEASNISV
jgi:hypothetical protein